MVMQLDGGSPDVPEGVARPVDEVIVIGAGMAGLTVGNALSRAGVPVTVVEARDRIGGRTFTADLDGTAVDLGASWIHSPEQNPLSRLADDLSVQRAPWEAFDAAWGWDSASGQLLEPREFRRLYEAADAVVEELADSSGDTSGARVLSDFIARHLVGQDLSALPRSRASSLARLFIEADTSARLEDVSSTWFPSNGLVLEGSPMGDVPIGGYRTFVDALADQLDILVQTEATSVTVREHGVEVECADGHVLSASHVVVTVPLGVLKAGAIAFDPPLAADRLDAVTRLGFGSFDKLALKFDHAFWTDAGVPHLVSVPSSGTAPVHAALGLDDAVSDPVLVLFGFGSTHEWLMEGDVAHATGRALEMLRGIFGPGVPDPTGAVRSEWSHDPFARGAYTYLTQAAHPADLDRLGRPHAQRVLFAGEATGYARVGYADGALMTGAREAKRLTGRPTVEIGRLGC